MTSKQITLSLAARVRLKHGVGDALNTAPTRSAIELSEVPGEAGNPLDAGENCLCHAVHLLSF
ncbi:hypothetical protein [Streptomyces sp. NBC_00344]|uniref:hypothetical protein n=1 Tax=Streptomyces sp. NBC_00344 TaxID=2975720 RepID=UPI002E1BB0C7